MRVMHEFPTPLLVDFECHLLQFLVTENKRIHNKVSDLFSPLMDVHYEKVDEAISPGLTLIHWNSLNLDAYIDSVTAAHEELELFIDRLNNMHNNRIKAHFEEIEKISLFNIPESSTMKPFEVYSQTKELCTAATVAIETKSQVVERAVEELINMLAGPKVVPEKFEDQSDPGAATLKRKMENWTKQMQETSILKRHYEQMLIDTLYRLLRSALEVIRKRLAISVVTYGELQKEKLNRPLFEADLILSVPTIIMIPGLDEMQQWLNKTVSAITSTTKSVFRWGQSRQMIPSRPEGEPNLQSRRTRYHITIDVPPPEKAKLKSFYRSVSEHKEIQKLVSALSSAINSTKAVFRETIKKFAYYNHLWKVDREQKMRKFIDEGNPGVSEFREEMSKYTELGDEILLEPDTMVAGVVLLSLDKLKLAFSTEARAWVVSYGHTMNHMYQTVMEEVFKSIEDWSKRLGSPVVDLDDIRSIMAALKEIREKEIQIDTSLDPFEV